jgi:hypothetical protein
LKRYKISQYRIFQILKKSRASPFRYLILTAPCFDHLPVFYRVIGSNVEFKPNQPVISTERVSEGLTGDVVEASVVVVEMREFGPNNKDAWVVFILLAKALQLIGS